MNLLLASLFIASQKDLPEGFLLGDPTRDVFLYVVPEGTKYRGQVPPGLHVLEIPQGAISQEELSQELGVLAEALAPVEGDLIKVGLPYPLVIATADKSAEARVLLALQDSGMLSLPVISIVSGHDPVIGLVAGLADDADPFAGVGGIMSVDDIIG